MTMQLSLLIPTFLLSSALLCGCGSGSGSGPEDLTLDPNPQVVGLEVRPQELELEIDATEQLFAAAAFSNGGRRIVNELVTWSTTNPAVATVSSTGVTTAIAPGQVTLFAAGQGLTASTIAQVPAPDINRIVVSSRETDSVQVLDLEGNVLRTLTNIPDPAQVVFVGNELYVGSGDEVLVYRWTASGNSAPVRSIHGFGQVTGLAVIGEELFVADFDQNAIRVFPVTAAGNATPVREITEGLDGPGLLTVHDELLIVANNRANSVLVFNPDGEQEALLEGPSTGLVNPIGVIVHEDEFFVSHDNAVSVFSLESDGDVSPERVLSSPALNRPAGLAIVGEELIVANEGGDNVLVFALDAADGDAPLRVLANVAEAAAVTAAFTP